MSESDEGDGGARWETGYQAQADHHAKSAVEWQRRFRLSLAVGNGAGLLAALSVLGGSAPDHQRLLVLPAAWILLVGVTSAGLVPAVLYHHHRAAEQDAEYMVHVLETRKQIPDFDPWFEGGAKATEAMLTARRVSERLEGISAAAFVLAGFVTLLQIALQTKLGLPH